MRVLFTLAAVILISNAPAVGQRSLQIVESTPAPRDSSVAMETTVSFTFSHPVDTSARFDGQGPLAFYAMGGDSLTIDSSYVSEDLKTFSFDVAHRDTADYVWILTGARASDGDELCSPYALTYTTESGWGRGLVGGVGGFIATTKSDVCRPFLAALLSAAPDSSAQLAAAVNLDDQSHFVFDGVREGKYWPILLIDWDQDGVIRPDWADAGTIESGIGLYNPDWDGRGDSIEVTDTTNLEIDIWAYRAGSVEGTELPGTARLLQNYPNPFEDRTMLAFELERPLRLSMTIHDLLGRQVAVLADGFYPMGRHEIAWSPTVLGSGIYIVRLSAEGFVLTRRLIRLASVR